MGQDQCRATKQPQGRFSSGPKSGLASGAGGRVCFELVLGLGFLIGCGATPMTDNLGTGRQAVTVPTWTIKNLTGTKPPQRFDHAMAYDPDRNVVIVFGGTIATDGDSELQDTWEWDVNGERWTEVGPATCAVSTCPPKRHGAAMVYDSGTKSMVLFGGHSYTAWLNDLWLWKAGAWTPVDESGQAIPAIRHNHSMVYDAGGSGGPILWMFGGDVNNMSARDLWGLSIDWNSTVPKATWSAVGDAPASMPSRYAQSMGYLPASDAFYIFGGRSFDNGTIGTLNDLWRMDHNAVFTNVSPQGPPQNIAPERRYGQAMAAYGDKLVVFSGEVAGASLPADTWEGNESGWEEITPTGTVPMGRMSAGLVATPKGLLLFGGRGYATSPGQREPMNDTYLYSRPGVPPVDGGTADAGGADGGGGDDAGGGSTDGGGGGDAGGVADGGGLGDGTVYPRYGCASASSALSAQPLLVALFLLLLLAIPGRRAGLLLLGLCLAWSPAASAERGARGAEKPYEHPRCAFVGIEANGSPDKHRSEEARALAEFVQSELGRLGVYDVMGPSEVRSLVGLERQRRLIGCGQSEGCGTEMSTALAASRSLSGSLVHVGERIILNLSLVDLETARSIGRTARYGTKIDELLPLVRPALIEILGKDELIAEDLPAKTEGSGSIEASLIRYPGTGMSLAARLDLELLATHVLGQPIGVATGITAVWRLGRAGLAASLLLQPRALRLTGRFHPVEIWKVLPYAEGGFTVFLDSVSLRLGGGVELGFEHLRPFLELSYEYGLTSWPAPGNGHLRRYQSSNLLLAGGLGWSF